MNLTFLVAVYNESDEIETLLDSVAPYVDTIIVSDDGSTDDTVQKVSAWKDIHKNYTIEIIFNSHIGLPEVVKKVGTEYVRYTNSPDQWILMLDADERLNSSTLVDIARWINTEDAQNITHVWFTLEEFIDGAGPTRVFQKCRLYRAGVAHFSASIHEDDHFDGQGASFGWKVYHRKTSDKQKVREREYIQTYKQLLEDGKVTQEWVDRCIGFHYFIKE